MKRVKQALALGLAAALLVALFAGCSKKESGGSTSGGSGENSVTTISFWHLFSGSEAEMLQAVVDRFNEENPDIFVEVLEGTTDEKQLVAISGGSPHDVGQLIDTSFSSMVNAGMVTQLDGYLADAGIDPQNFHPAALELNMQDGKQYGVPFTMDSFLLFYNKDILEELGETEPPRTIGELQDLAWRATQLDDSGDYQRIGMIPDWPWIDVMNLPFHFGGDFYDFETGTVTANSPENVAVLSFKASLYNEPYDRDRLIKFRSGFGQYQSAENPFFQGKVAFTIEGEWYPTFIEQFAPELNYGVASIPYPDGQEELRDVCRLQTAVLYIPENSKNKEEAFRFLSYLVSDEAQLDFNLAKGGLPVTDSALHSDRIAQEAPHLEPFVELVNAGVVKAFPAVPFAKEYADTLYTTEENIYLQGIDPQEAMDDVVRKIQPLADDWNND